MTNQSTAHSADLQRLAARSVSPTTDPNGPTRQKGTIMNTTIDQTPSTNVGTGTTRTPRGGASPRRSGIRRIVGGALAALLLGLGVGAVSNVQPAAAASGMTLCLKTRTGLTISPAWAYSEIYVQGQWYPTQLKSNGSNGCVTFYLSGAERNFPARIRVPSQSSGTNTIGYTTGWVPAGSLSYHFGTKQPWCVGFCYGY